MYKNIQFAVDKPINSTVSLLPIQDTKNASRTEYISNILIQTENQASPILKLSLGKKMSKLNVEVYNQFEIKICLML